MRDTLAGLSVPSLDELINSAISRLGSGVIDLAQPMQRRRLQLALHHSLAIPLRWELSRAVKRATEKAVDHAFALMEDGDYQARRETRRKKSSENSKKKLADEREQQAISRELNRQTEKEIVQ